MATSTEIDFTLARETFKIDDLREFLKYPVLALIKGRYVFLSQPFFSFRLHVGEYFKCKRYFD